jgi:hypothetical protein
VGVDGVVVGVGGGRGGVVVGAWVGLWGWLALRRRPLSRKAPRSR